MARRNKPASEWTATWIRCAPTSSKPDYRTHGIDLGGLRCARRRTSLRLPSWSDKLVAEVVRLLLEAYYEPQFSARSHGFRPGRGCHTALREVAVAWTGTTWFIEGDISGCFDSFDRQVMLDALGENIHDNRMLRLVSNMLNAGYLEDWVWNPTLSGVPQGGVASPILSNIYLHRLDTFVEKVLLPEYNTEGVRRHNPAYSKVQYALAQARRRGDHAAARDLRKRLRGLPTQDPNDPGYRRLRYTRYADDILLGFVGPKVEAEEITRRLGQFLLEDLKLELSETKTLITHARTDAARFLGYEITTQHANHVITGGRRAANGASDAHGQQPQTGDRQWRQRQPGHERQDVALAAQRSAQRPGP